MRFIDFSTWQGALMTLLALAVVALVGVGIRILVMLTIQQRQQRLNRQINERLRTLIAAYKVLGGSFTGELDVSPAHLRETRASPEALGGEGPPTAEAAVPGEPPSDRPRRIRDAVEAALSDIILLGTEEQVKLAAQAASDMAAGRSIQTAPLVVSLRNFVRKALDLAPIPESVVIPLQGPTRPGSGGGRSGGRGEQGRERVGGGGGGSAGGSGGGGMGLGLGLGAGRRDPGSDD